MTWVLGGFAERIAAPVAALHAVPDGLAAAGAAMAEPLAAALHAVARAGDAHDAAVLGGGTMGLMLARLLALEGRDVTLCDRHPQRRAQAEALGVRAVERLGRHELVMEAVGRPESWRAAIDHALPGGTVVLVGGCPAGMRGDAAVGAAALRRARRPRRLSPHPGGGRPRARAAGAAATSTGARWPASGSASTACTTALVRPNGGEARKLVVDPRL